ncbi:antA/AntB antirepressor family protein [Shigella flexneri]|nr:antA/AntB antirepressor family protein [Shigella flexneri]
MNLVIQQHHDLQHAVDAKQLYTELGLDKSNWAKWSQRNITNNEFALEYADYVGFVQTTNGNSTQNFLLSIPFAKKLAMQVKTQKGEDVRNYFLECEQKAQQPQIALPQDYLSALKALVTSEEQKQALAIENQTLKPKAEQWQRFIDTDGLLPSRTIGKPLGFKSAQEFNKAIKEKRVAFKADDGTWQFYADFKDKEIGKMVAWEKGEYNKAGTQLKWHTRAVEYFANLFNRQVQGGI